MTRKRNLMLINSSYNQEKDEKKIVRCKQVLVVIIYAANFLPPANEGRHPPAPPPQQTVNKWVLCIPLECILV